MSRRAGTGTRGVLSVGVLLLATAGCGPGPGESHAGASSSTGSSSTASSSTASSGTAAPDGTLDLLSQDWRLAGMTTGPDGLQVAATGFRIVHQDGSGGQPNPPVNLYGSHLAVRGNFSVSVTLAQVTADASVALYDRPPVIADEFRIEPPGVRLTLQGRVLEIQVFDGSTQGDVTQPKPVFDRHVTVTDPGSPLTVERSGSDLRFGSGGATVATLGSGGVFSSGAVWLGLSSDAGSFVVPSFTARGVDGGGVTAVDTTATAVATTPDGLQALASRVRPGFLVGAAVALGPLVEDPAYAGTVVSNFGSVTLENAMKAQFISPRQGVYDFAEADAVIAIAHAQGIAVHGHTLAFSEAEPRWMRDLPVATAAQRRASGTVLLDYVRTVVTHFRGRLASLDVVNEPLDTDQGTGLQRNIWYAVFGPGYPEVVSQAVYAADPGVPQFINENGAEAAGDRQDALLQLIEDTNAKGGHITGVGLQAHVYSFDSDRITAADLDRTFDRFGDHGLQVRISENDVTDDSGTSAQADQYAAVFTACLSNPRCISYTTWGVDDRYDWFVDDDGSLQQGHDLLVDNGRPTAAYDALQRSVSK